MSPVLDPVECAPPPVAPPRCRTAALASAVVLSLLFLVSGLWKVSDFDATSQRMVQSLIPTALSMPAAVAVSAFELLAGILLLFRATRRWGALLAAAMLVAFMAYIGLLYDRLLGEDCNCFPWIHRVVGPAFFAGDALMLLLAAAAALWSPRFTGYRTSLVSLLAVLAVVTGAYAWTMVRRGSSNVPAVISAGGQPFQLRQGLVLLYFFDPECSHCYTVASEMSRRQWGRTRVIALATRQPEFTPGFLSQAGLRAQSSPDAGALRKVFPFTDPPYAVALRHGVPVAFFNSGELQAASFYASLRQLGFLQ